MIQINKLNKYYPVGHGKFQALKNIDLTVADGEMTAIIGKSGAGKSTLLHILGGLDTFDSGEYFLDGKNMASLSDTKAARIRNEKIGFVMQDFALINDQTVLFNVMLPLLLGNRMRFGKIKAFALETLDSVGIGSQAGKKVNQLSGGQKQRVAIARAVITSPKLLLADEPTGALDSKTSAEIMEIIGKLNRDGLTVIIVTHDELVRSCCTRAVCIADGEIVPEGSDELLK